MASCISGANFEGKEARDFFLEPFYAHEDELRETYCLAIMLCMLRWRWLNALIISISSELCRIQFVESYICGLLPQG